MPGAVFKKRKSLCERHIFEKYSGLGFECSMCGKIFNRPDNHGNGYDGSELDLKKRSTRTFTEQESEEYRNFMREINKNIFITKEKQTIMTPKDKKNRTVEGLIKGTGVLDNHRKRIERNPREPDHQKADQRHHRGNQLTKSLKTRKQPHYSQLHTTV